MARHAGSAVTKIGDNPRKWLIDYLGPQQTKWFIFQGATDPPRNSSYQRNGEYRNLTQDLRTAMDFLIVRNEFTLDKYHFNMDQKKEQIMKDIKDFLEKCAESLETLPVLYYTGHGIMGSGNWSFDNSEQISVKEVVRMIPNRIRKVFIFVDCCFSGHWADYCMETKNCKLEVLAASSYCMESFDNKFSEWLFNNIPTGIVPIYGSYDHSDEEHSYKREFESIDTFIDSHIFGKDRVINTIVAFTGAGKTYSAIFAQKPSVKIPGHRNWIKCETLSEIVSEIENKKQNNRKPRMNLKSINYIEEIL